MDIDFCSAYHTIKFVVRHEHLSAHACRPVERGERGKFSRTPRRLGGPAVAQKY